MKKCCCCNPKKNEKNACKICGKDLKECRCKAEKESNK